MRLRRRERQYARSLARQCFIEANGDQATFETLFNARARTVSIDPAMLALLIQLALMLFKWWIEKEIQEPSVVASSDEPGYFDEDENDAD